MAHRIEVSPAAARQLKKIDRRVLPQIAEKIDSLASEPRPHGCEKLSGYHSHIGGIGNLVDDRVG